MNKRTKGESLFPMWLFFVYLGVLLLMSGIHSGLLLGAGQWGWGGLLRTLSPILYWAAPHHLRGAHAAAGRRHPQGGQGGFFGVPGPHPHP